MPHDREQFEVSRYEVVFFPDLPKMGRWFSPAMNSLQSTASSNRCGVHLSSGTSGHHVVAAGAAG